MKKGKTRKDAEVKDLDKMESLNFQCVNGNDKFMLYPILEWTVTDVWKFIAKRNLPYNPCYDFSDRLGCMFCPFASKEQIEMFANLYPKHYERLKQSLRAFIEKNTTLHLTVDEYLDWWKSKKSLQEYNGKRKQLQLFENQ